MNLSLKEWNLIIDALRIAEHEISNPEYEILADKIENTKFTSNMSSFSPD